MSVFDDQMEMMKAFGQKTEYDLPQAILYMDLVEEEFEETGTAFAEIEVAHANGAPIDSSALVEVADGIIDTIVVLCGLGISLGLPLQAIWDEVLRSNMSKVHPDGTVRRRDDGKVLKPSTYSPPDIASILVSP